MKVIYNGADDVNKSVDLSKPSLEEIDLCCPICYTEISTKKKDVVESTTYDEKIGNIPMMLAYRHFEGTECQCKKCKSKILLDEKKKTYAGKLSVAITAALGAMLILYTLITFTVGIAYTIDASIEAKTVDSAISEYEKEKTTETVETTESTEETITKSIEEIIEEDSATTNNTANQSNLSETLTWAICLGSGILIISMIVSIMHSAISIVSGRSDEMPSMIGKVVILLVLMSILFFARNGLPELFT